MAQLGDAAKALACDEAEVGIVVVHIPDEDLDRAVDHVLRGARVQARRAEHRPQCPERLFYQDKP